MSCCIVCVVWVWCGVGVGSFGCVCTPMYTNEYFRISVMYCVLPVNALKTSKLKLQLPVVCVMQEHASVDVENMHI